MPALRARTFSIECAKGYGSLFKLYTIKEATDFEILGSLKWCILQTP